MPQEETQAQRPSSHRFGRLVTALVAGVAGGLVAPLVYPVLARNARPVIRQAFKLGIAAVERGRELAAEFGEHASDLMAEARAERDAELKPSTPETPPSPAQEVVRLRSSAREGAAT
jgi:hypothetical protein